MVQPLNVRAINQGRSNWPVNSVTNLAAGAVVVNLVADGTFDSGIDNWTHTSAGTGTSISWTGSALRVATSTDDNLTGAEQAITTEAGVTYTFQFDVVALTNGCDYRAQASTVTTGADLLATGRTDATAGQSYSHSFTATGTTTYISLFGQTNNGVAGTIDFDNVVVVPA